MLAYFGALRPNPWQCADAVRATLAMCATLRDYNVELAREGLPALSLGIGIRRGPGLSGMIGSRERRAYGFVGRTVQRSGACGDRRCLRTAGDAAGTRKGIDEPVATWAVLSARPSKTRANGDFPGCLGQVSGKPWPFTQPENQR